MVRRFACASGSTGQLDVPRSAPSATRRRRASINPCRKIAGGQRFSHYDTELFLTLEGYETQSAASVADAEELLAKLMPGDLLISDYHLNGALTGLDAPAGAYACNAQVPAFLLSGDLQSMMRVVKTRFRAAGF